MSKGGPLTADGLPSATTIALILTFVITASMFVPTAVGFVSYDQVQTAEMTVEEIDIVDDGSTLHLTIAFSNPTIATVDVVGAELFAYVDGDIVNHIAGVRADQTTVSPGETQQFDVRVPIRDGQTERVEQALASGNLVLSGDIWVEVSNERRTVNLKRSSHD